jgi:SET family sugar efflux transporter-like MFS transporter
MHRLVAPARIILHHRGFMVLLACNILVGLAFAFVSPFFSIFGTRKVGMSPFVFGVFMTVLSLSAIVISTWLARWSDTRLPRRTVLLIGGVAGMLNYLGYAWVSYAHPASLQSGFEVHDLVSLTINGCLLGGIASITFSQLFAYARDLLACSDIPTSHAPLYMNVFRLFFAVSWTAGPAVAAWVMLRYDFVGMFLVAALCFLLFVIILLGLVPSTPPLASARAAAAQMPLRRVLVRADILAYFTSFSLLFAAGTMGMLNLPLLVLNVLNGTGQQVGIIYSVAPAFEIPFMLYFGLLATKSDQARLIRIAVIIAVVYYALLSFVRVPWQVYPLQILSAAITAVVGGIAITFFQNFLPEQPGTATNLYSTAGRIGGTVGYLVFGALASAFGYRAVFFACTGMAVLALAILLTGCARRPVLVPP